jgi:hypothetical protein
LTVNQPGYSKYKAYAANTIEMFPDNKNQDLVVSNKLEVAKHDELIIEEGDIIYKESDRQDDGLIKANIDFQ